MTSTKNSKKRKAPKNPNKVQNKSKVKVKENQRTTDKDVSLSFSVQRTRKKQKKRKREFSGKKSAYLKQPAKIVSSPSVKSLKSDVNKSNVKSPKSHVKSKSPKSTKSSTAISSERFLKTPRKEVSPEPSPDDHEIKLCRIWEKELYRFDPSKSKSKFSVYVKSKKRQKRILLKIQKGLDEGKSIASIVENIKTTVEPNIYSVRDKRKEEHKKTLKYNASKIKIKVPTDKTKHNAATNNNTHDNCNNDVKDDLKFMSSILEIFNIPRKHYEKGLQKDMLHFLSKYYRTFLNKYMMKKIQKNSEKTKSRKWDYFKNEDVEKTIEKLNEETKSIFPPLREELILKAIQETSSVQHAFYRSSKSNKTDELKVPDTENTISNKDNTTGVDENNHSVMNNSTMERYIFNEFYANYVRIQDVNRSIMSTYFSQFVPQHEQNIQLPLEMEDGMVNTPTNCTDTMAATSTSATIYYQHPQCMYMYPGATTVTLAGVPPAVILPAVMPMVPPMGVSPIAMPPVSTQYAGAPPVVPQQMPYGQMLSSPPGHPDSNNNQGAPQHGENANYNNQRGPNYERDVFNYEAMTGNGPMNEESNYEGFDQGMNMPESNMSREDENVSVAGDTSPIHFSFPGNLAESISSSEEENYSVARDTSPKHFKFQDSLEESNSSSEDCFYEKFSVAGDISPKHFSFQNDPAEWKSYGNTCYSTKDVISERLDRLRASIFYNIF